MWQDVGEEINEFFSATIVKCRSIDDRNECIDIMSLHKWAAVNGLILNSSETHPKSIEDFI